MSESDSILQVFTVASTIAVAVATFLVWKATSKVAHATKETTKLTIMPRISVINHAREGSDNEYDHYVFILRNEGVGNAFDVEIEVIHKSGNPVSITFQTFPVNAGQRFYDKYVGKDDKEVNFKIKYKDHADNEYKREFTYSLENQNPDYSVMARPNN